MLRAVHIIYLKHQVTVPAIRLSSSARALLVSPWRLSVTSLTTVVMEVMKLLVVSHFKNQ